MKKFTFIFIALLLTSGHIVYGEETVPNTSTRQNILKERIEKQRSNYVQGLQEARLIAEQYRAATNPEQKANLRLEARNGFLVRLTNTVQTIEKLQEKINQRIILAKEKGLDVAEAEKNLELSKTYSRAVVKEQEKLKTLLEKETVTKEEVKQSFEIIKDSLSKSRVALIDSMQILKKIVVGSLQNNNDKPEDENEDEQTITNQQI